MLNGDGAKLLVGLLALLLAVVLIGGAAHIHSQVGPRAFYWPRLDHADERHHAARLAAVPWLLLLFLTLGNALAILLLSRDLQGATAEGLGPWLLGSLPAAVMFHLLGARHSRAAAVVTLALVAAVAAVAALHPGSRSGALLAAPLLLWSANGVRATFADRAALGG